MKKLILSTVSVCFLSMAHAQLKTDSSKFLNKGANVKAAPTNVKIIPTVQNIPNPAAIMNKESKRTQTASQPGSPTAGNQSSLGALYAASPCTFPGHSESEMIMTCYTSYYLTGVTLKIYTGNDNKEYPSTTDIRVDLPYGSPYTDNVNAPTLLYSNESDGTSARTKEYKSNSVTTLNLTSPNSLFDGVNSEYRPNDLLLGTIQKSGLLIEVNYFANLLTDAWKIEKIEITFQVKKPSGITHPQYNNKTITFNHPKLLTSGSGTKNTFIMRVDGSLNAGTAY